jgi:hypothetical protein
LAGQFGPRSILVLSGVSCRTAATVAAVGGRRRSDPPSAVPGDAEQAA